MNVNASQMLFAKAISKVPTVVQLNDHEQAVSPLSRKDRQILILFWKVYTNHLISATQESVGRGFSSNGDILLVPAADV